MIYLLLAFFAVYPVANMIMLAEGMGLATITGAALLVAAPLLLVRNIFIEKKKVNFSVPMIMLFLLLVYFADSGFWAYNSSYFKDGIFAFGQTVLLLAIADLFVRTQRECDLLMMAFQAGTLLLSFLIFADFVSGELYVGAFDQLEDERYSIAGADPNIMALHLCLGLALTLGHCSVIKHIVVNYAFAGALFLAIVLTGSRTGFLAAAVILSIFVIYQANWKRALISWTALFACLLALYVGWDFQNSEIKVDRVEDMLNQGVNTDLAGRDILWANVLDAFSYQPLLGVGYGSFSPYHLDNYGIPHVAHNTHLGVMVETGIIGLLLFWAVLAMAPVYWLRLADRDVKRTYLALFTALMACSMTLVLEQHFSFWIFLLFLQRTAMLSTAEDRDGHNPHRNPELEARLQAIKRPEITEQPA